MISGAAVQPRDVLKTRDGVTIEVVNTDAEVGLVPCDLLAEASHAAPAILLNFATLTGAARWRSVRPAALFSKNDLLISMFLECGEAMHDAVWRRALRTVYNSWLARSVAGLNYVAEQGHVGTLFLQRFVRAGTPLCHFDLYGWNDAARHVWSADGEVQGRRGVFETSRVVAAEDASTIVHVVFYSDMTMILK